jgi:plasmid stabilization system protein ParE
MVTIYWTDEAIEWLQNIHAYIAKNNSKAARNTVDKILAKAKLLEDFPELGGIYPLDFPYSIRVIYYSHYRIAYKIVSEKRVDILGVFHGAMEMKNYLK